MLDNFFRDQHKIVESLQYDFERYLYKKINWDSRAIAIVGSRGTGKTTMLLQYYLNNFSSPEECLYILGDDLEVLDIGIMDIAREFEQNGGKVQTPSEPLRRSLLITQISKLVSSPQKYL